MIERNKDSQKNRSDNKQNENNGGNIHGRLDHTANPEFTDEENRSDISQVDRQEGTMENGELGGNFNNSKDNE